MIEQEALDPERHARWLRTPFAESIREQERRDRILPRGEQIDLFLRVQAQAPKPKKPFWKFW